MKASNERRLAALNSAVGGSEVILHMPDGSVRQIRGDNKHFEQLALLLDGTEGSPSLACELNWIKTASSITEGRFQLLQALLLSPNLEGEDNVIAMSSNSDEEEEDRPR